MSVVLALTLDCIVVLQMFALVHTGKRKRSASIPTVCEAASAANTKQLAEGCSLARNGSLAGSYKSFCSRSAKVASPWCPLLHQSSKPRHPSQCFHHLSHSPLPSQGSRLPSPTPMSGEIYSGSERMLALDSQVWSSKINSYLCSLHCTISSSFFSSGPAPSPSSFLPSPSPQPSQSPAAARTPQNFSVPSPLNTPGDLNGIAISSSSLNQVFVQSEFFSWTWLNERSLIKAKVGGMGEHYTWTWYVGTQWCFLFLISLSRANIYSRIGLLTRKFPFH